MLELFNVQVPKAVYRIEPLPPPPSAMYRITYYPSQTDENPLAPIISITAEAIPDWMQHYIRILNLAGSGHEVKGVGTKIGENYWIADASTKITFT